MKATFVIQITLLLFSISSMAQEKVQNCIPCEELYSISIPDVKITIAESLDHKKFQCKVEGVIGKEIKFQLLLPNEWDKRFVMRGNGGYAGSFQRNYLFAVPQGSATGVTDTGHEGKFTDASWALNNEERKINFGYLAVHRTTVTIKEILKQYYDTPTKYSYFIGCSKGGEQGMMSANRYPEDFDGIVAGAPAFNWTDFAAKCIQVGQLVYPDGNHNNPRLTPANIKLLHELILSECDGLDGLNDNILNDPTDCVIDFETFPVCPGQANDNCFTKEQLNIIKKIYSPLHNEQGEIHAGYPYGCENEKWAWIPSYLGSKKTMQEVGYPSFHLTLAEIFKFFIFNDSTWDYTKYKFDNFQNEALQAASYLNVPNSDYADFKKAGGKMIIYQGWNDPMLSSLGILNFYKSMEKSNNNVEEYIRLFLTPGVLHCWNGSGPDYAPWLKHMIDWVEKDNAPDKIVLSKYKGDSVIMTRPVFPYPYKAKYDGKGDPNLHNSFTKNDYK